MAKEINEEGENSMAKIIRMPTKDGDYRNAQHFMQHTLEIFETEGVESHIVVAGKNREGEVITGYYKCGFGDRQEICGHIQCDIIDQMIRANPERYGGQG